MARTKTVVPRQCSFIIGLRTRWHIPYASTPKYIEIGASTADANAVGIIESVEFDGIIVCEVKFRLVYHSEYISGDGGERQG